MNIYLREAIMVKFKWLYLGSYYGTEVVSSGDMSGG